MRAMKKTSSTSSKNIFFYAAVWLVIHRSSCMADVDAPNNNAQTVLLANSTDFQLPEHKIRIVGGFDALNGRFPYGQVSLLSSSEKHQCGGTIVAPDVIMTAAHCAIHIDLVKVGEYNRNDENEQQEELIRMFRPIKTLIHPLFDRSMFRFDVMLIKLNARVDDISPVRLNDDSNIPSQQQQQQQLLTLIGWGALGFDDENDGNSGGGRRFPDVLQQANVPYVPNRECEKSKYEGRSLYQGEIFNEMLCAGSNGVDACKGDSGSPLIVEKSHGNDDDVQVGIVSWGRGCGKVPGVYTRVSKVFYWVRVNLCWHSASPPPYLNCRPFERPNIDTEEEEEESYLSNAPSMEPSSMLDLSSESKDTRNDNDGDIVYGSPDGVENDAPPIPDFVFNSEQDGSASRSQMFASYIQASLSALGFALGTILAFQ